MTVVIIQCRLNSTRLPQKALLPLDGKPMITWTFEAMRKIEADYYYLATDKNSSNELRPIASACGWNVYAGSEENVLQRFCDVIKLTNADTVVRATGDNPFLFYEAAVESLNAFRKYDCDYFTFTGLPHGSGIEVFKASALLKANEKITDMTEREHVGPAIYQYKDEYKVVFEPSSAKYEYPIYRTTVDTYEDYLKATRIVRFLQNKYSYLENPYEAKYIIEALSSPMVNTPLLLIPSVKKGRGTGHFRRCSALAKISGAHIYVPKENVMSEVVDLIKESGSKLTIINDLPKNDKYSIYITDYFKLTKEEAIKFSEKTSLIAIDEGSEYTDYCDFLLDIIPSLKNTRKANYTNPAFIELPKNRKLKTAEKSPIKSVLIALGGEDPASLSKIAALACEKAGLQVTQLVKPIPDLREELYKYDLVMTHYGFTAFEAVAAGCAVILLETSKLHKKLAKKYGFAFIGKKNLNEFFVKQNIKNSKKLYVSNEQLSAMFDDSSILAMYLNTLSTGTKYKCPLNDHCVKKEFPDKVISRTPNKTIRRCQKCGILYVSWNMQAEKKYEKNYFFREYLNQYGKTYLEDFASIKLQGKRRLKNIYNIDKNKKIKNILDIGCAYGAFLSAAKDTGLKAFGLD
ncbi:MAG: acylneuraminate cytidylyltransferase, partial [Treponema sp.]|nr:acylneuraminate cytidylyltransferase [Treponema sp.]